MNAVSLKTVNILERLNSLTRNYHCRFCLCLTASTRHALYQQHAERLKKEFKMYVNSLCLNRNWTLRTQQSQSLSADSFQHWLLEFVLLTSPPLHHHTHPVPFWISLISVNITTIHLLSAKGLVNTHPKYFSRTAYSLSSPLFYCNSSRCPSSLGLLQQPANLSPHSACLCQLREEASVTCITLSEALQGFSTALRIKSACRPFGRVWACFPA